MAPKIKAHYLTLFESATEVLHPYYGSILESQYPQDFATDLGTACKKHINPVKRVFYRRVLFKKPIVSIAKLSKISNSSLSAPGQGHFFIQEAVYDHTLTIALRNPTVLRNVDPDSFYAEYTDVMVEPGASTPCAAILIHYEDEHAMANILGIVSFVVSIALNVVDVFVF